jgi:hypothetical protein
MNRVSIGNAKICFEVDGMGDEIALLPTDQLFELKGQGWEVCGIKRGFVFGSHVIVEINDIANANLEEIRRQIEQLCLNEGSVDATTIQASMQCF